MTPETFNRIRADKGLSIADVARLLRIRDRSTIHRWATGHTPVSGPASIVLELIEADALPYKYFHGVGVKVPS